MTDSRKRIDWPQAICKWISLIGLGAAGGACLLALPLAFFIGIMAADSGLTPLTAAISLGIMAFPIALAGALWGLALLLRRFPNGYYYSALPILLGWVFLGVRIEMSWAKNPPGWLRKNKPPSNTSQTISSNLRLALHQSHQPYHQNKTGAASEKPS